MKYKEWECRVLKENEKQAFIEVDKGDFYARGWVDKTDIEDYSFIQTLMNRYLN
ncbi:MAG TPA: hypothetical protein VFD03_06180 [Clostridia bacterium]|nr:hypothetical protein [Clostridia bacterium]